MADNKKYGYTGEVSVWDAAEHAFQEMFWGPKKSVEDGNKTVQSRGTATSPGQAAAAPRSPSSSGGPKPNARARTSHNSGSSSSSSSSGSSKAAAAPKPKKKPEAVKGVGRRTSQPRNPAMSNEKPKQDRGPEKARASAKKAATSSNTKSKKAAKSFWDQVKSGPSKSDVKRIEKKWSSKNRNR